MRDPALRGTATCVLRTHIGATVTADDLAAAASETYPGSYSGSIAHKIGRNAASTWTRIDSREQHLPSMRIWALAFDTQTQNTLLVGSHSAGVYVVPRNGEGFANAIQQ